MEKQAIGFKEEVPLYLIVFLLVFGVVAIIVGILLYALTPLSGALGGGLLGAFIGVGVYIIITGIQIIMVPKELIFLDEQNVYVGKKQIPLNTIVDIKSKKGAIEILTQAYRNSVVQSFLKSSKHVKMIILSAVSALHRGEPIDEEAIIAPLVESSQAKE